MWSEKYRGKLFFLPIQFKEIKRDSIAKEILRGRDLCNVAEILFNTVFEGSIANYQD